MISAVHTNNLMIIKIQGKYNLNYFDFDLQECPLCLGTGHIEEECDWCLYVQCVDCDAHTVEIPYNNEQEKEEAAEKAVHLWNAGKVITGVPI